MTVQSNTFQFHKSVLTFKDTRISSLWLFYIQTMWQACKLLYQYRTCISISVRKKNRGLEYLNIANDVFLGQLRSINHVAGLTTSLWHCKAWTPEKNNKIYQLKKKYSMFLFGNHNYKLYKSQCILNQKQAITTFHLVRF